MSALGVDVAVLGGGAAGRAAMGVLLHFGAAARLLDEPAPADPALWSAPIEGVRVWGVGRDGAGFRLDGVEEAGGVTVIARALILATGAHGSHIPHPHWIPSTEASRMLGVAHVDRASHGGVVPMMDEAQRCGQARLYAAGDCAGLGGDAVHEGEVAARAALADLGLAAPADIPPRPRIDHSAAHGRLRAACAALPGVAVLCPCEAVTRADIDRAIADGAADPNQLKSFTRAGMGRCQSRLCGTVLAELGGGRATPRLPLRPVPMRALLGAFDYADIPVPAAAPI